MIKLLRVDKRLLHGQVAFTWTASVGADCILIACDTLQDDPPHYHQVEQTWRSEAGD